MKRLRLLVGAVAAVAAFGIGLVAIDAVIGSDSPSITGGGVAEATMSSCHSEYTNNAHYVTASCDENTSGGTQQVRSYGVCYGVNAGYLYGPWVSGAFSVSRTGFCLGGTFHIKGFQTR